MSIRRASGRLLRLPLLPLRGVLVFPHAVTQLDIGRPRSLRAVEAAMATGGRIVLAMQKDARKQNPMMMKSMHSGPWPKCSTC